MDSNKVAMTFNRWLDDYINSPEKFNREWESVYQFIQETCPVDSRDYGKVAAEYFLRKLGELE